MWRCRLKTSNDELRSQFVAHTISEVALARCVPQSWCRATRAACGCYPTRHTTCRASLCTWAVFHIFRDTHTCCVDLRMRDTPPQTGLTGDLLRKSRRTYFIFFWRGREGWRGSGIHTWLSVTNILHRFGRRLRRRRQFQFLN